MASTGACLRVVQSLGGDPLTSGLCAFGFGSLRDRKRFSLEQWFCFELFVNTHVYTRGRTQCLHVQVWVPLRAVSDV